MADLLDHSSNGWAAQAVTGISEMKYHIVMGSADNTKTGKVIFNNASTVDTLKTATAIAVSNATGGYLSGISQVMTINQGTYDPSTLAESDCMLYRATFNCRRDSRRYQHKIYIPYVTYEGKAILDDLFSSAAFLVCLDADGADTAVFLKSTLLDM